MAAVHCSKCGEELLGAVNRCWKCGQQFALAPEADGKPPVRAAVISGGGQPLEAVVVGEVGQISGLPILQPGETLPRLPVATPRIVLPQFTSTGELVEARRAGLMAMGGTVASLVLGLFAAVLAALWPPAAIVAVLGLIMGIWGLSSPRRNWALVGMLLCCLAIGLGTFGVVRRVYIAVRQNKAITIDESPAVDEP